MISVQVVGVDRLVVLLKDTAQAASTIGAMQAVIGTDLSYARFVHDGTGPHVIAARNAKALRWESGGAVHFARSVNHPGYKGNPFLTDALATKGADVVAELSAGMDAVVAGGPPSEMSARLMAAGLIVQGEAMRLVNVRTGQLRQSLHTQVIAGRLP